jgi:hypothetical protein
MSPNATSRQLHVSLAENHRCDPVVRLRITSGLPVIRPESIPSVKISRYTATSRQPRLLF